MDFCPSPILCCLLVLIVFSSFQVKSSCFTVTTHEEAKGLLKWKDTLHVTNLSLLSSWVLPPAGHVNTSLFHCHNWYGVTCNHLGRVVNITLSSIGLTGTLHAFPFSFQPHLNLLNLSSNNLSGSIPVHVSNLSQISTLDLSNNSLSGNIPSSIGNLTNLKFLVLNKNQLSGTIPLELGNLEVLVEIFLSSNNLTGQIPSSLGNLSTLDVLSLHVNQLYGYIPSELGKLKLRNLTLSRNNLSGHLPDFLCYDGRLQDLSLGHNNFIGPIPNSLKNCASLRRLHLNDNNLVMNITGAFGIYPKLYRINLSNNMLFGELSDNWSQCTSLRDFLASGNNITGWIPRGFGNLMELGRLDISSNQLIGEIPKELGNLSILFDINLHDNNLHGGLPMEIGSLDRLQNFDVSNNKLTGQIPKELGDCSSLLYLNLSHNKFIGNIPSELGNIARLSRFLDLSWNYLTGGIPLGFGRLGNLEVLNLSNNILTGEIPHSFEDMISLTTIDVSYNKLAGPVPKIKVFQEAPSQSFSHNKGLCGNNKALQPCISSKTNPISPAKRHKEIEVIVLAIGGMLVLACVLIGIFLAFWKRNKNQEEETGSTTQHDLFSALNYDGKIVYEEIIAATEGFDTKHCIGVGSYGSVYKAILSTGQVVAVKKFHLLQEDFEVIHVKSFESEVEALKNLRHRNIVKLYGFCSHVRHSFLVYQYLERGSLDKALNKIDEASNLDWLRRIKIIKSIANALSYMHHDCSPPLIHRDISAKNIMLSLEYDAFVGDFGIARFLNSNSTNWTELAGTYGYLAPEFAYTMRLTAKCDIYSFGVLSLEVIMGSHPGEFISSLAMASSGSQIETLMVDILDKRPQPPSPETFEEICLIAKLALACLNTNPEFRPTSKFVSEKLSTH